MTEKTNQFNVFKNPLTEEQIAQFIKSPQHKVFYGRLMDRFGDYGVIIFALVDISQEVWNIRSLLMSCRVFNRSVEEAFLSEIIKRAIEDGALKIKIDFQESQKNAPAQEFVEKHFINGQRDLSEVFKRPEWIRVTA